MIVHHVVLPLRAELVERLGHLPLLVDQHDVPPRPAIGEIHALLHRTVGVDRVARMDEEVGLMPGHGGVSDHAVFVDAPSLPRGVARPHEADAAAVRGCGAEAADHGRAHRVYVVEVLRREAVEDVLSRRQVREQALHRKVSLWQRVDRVDRAGVGKALRRRDLRPDPCGTVGAGPDHAGRRVDVARLHAVRKGRRGLRAQDRRGGKQRHGGGTSLEDRAARRLNSEHGLLPDVVSVRSRLP